VIARVDSSSINIVRVSASY